MKPRVWVYAICWNEAAFIPFFLRHYSTFAEKIIIYDEQSTDGTRAIIKACPIAELREWPHKGLDDDRFLEAINSLYKEARGKADWVMWPDVDEILYHPDPLSALGNAKGNLLMAEGYALISKDYVPSGTQQIYEIVQTGHRQDNYDKAIIWRPEIDIQHTHGRHSQSGFPKGAVIVDRPAFKLLHCHYFGINGTASRNRRNFDRAANKRFAWNYAPGHNDNPKQNGSLAWVREIIMNNRLINVIGSSSTVKLHLGCGGMFIPGWDNHDLDVDIRKPLPFPSDSASYIFIEHCIEHVTHQQAWNFFEECRRVLRPNGVLRVAFPDVHRMWIGMTSEYAAVAGGSPRAAVKAAVFNHGHHAAWTENLMWAFLTNVGFTSVRNAETGESEDPELRGIEQHGKTVGESIARVETSVVEAIK